MKKQAIHHERPGKGFDKKAFAHKIASEMADAVVADVNVRRKAKGKAPLKESKK